MSRVEGLDGISNGLYAGLKSTEAIVDEPVLKRNVLICAHEVPD